MHTYHIYSGIYRILPCVCVSVVDSSIEHSSTIRNSNILFRWWIDRIHSVCVLEMKCVIYSKLLRLANAKCSNVILFQCEYKTVRSLEAIHLIFTKCLIANDNSLWKSLHTHHANVLVFLVAMRRGLAMRRKTLHIPVFFFFFLFPLYESRRW